MLKNLANEQEEVQPGLCRSGSSRHGKSFWVPHNSSGNKRNARGTGLINKTSKETKEQRILTCRVELI